MVKLFFLSMLLWIMIPLKGISQSPKPLPVSTYKYHPPSEDKESWQRLNLWNSATYYRGIRQSKINHDSSLIAVSKALGLSRLPFAAEGIDNPELLAQSGWFDQRDPGKGNRLLAQATGKKHLELMVLLGSYYVFQPDNYKLYRDSVEYFLKKAVTESKTVDEGRLGRVALCLLGKMYTQGADTINANAVFSQLSSECQKAGDKKTEARAFAYRALYTTYSPTSVENRIGYYKKAAEIYHGLNEIESEIGVTTNLALIYFATRRLDSAYQYFLKALALEDSIGYPYTHYNTDHLASITMFQGKFGEPLRYALETTRVAETTRDSLGFSDFYLRLGQLYTYLDNRLDESLKYMRKSLDILVRAKERKVFLNLANIVALMNARKGREQEALDLVLDISKQISPITDEEYLNYNMVLCRCYLGVGQYKLAEQYAASADSIQKVSPALPPISRMYNITALNNLFIAIHMAKGEFVAAKKILDANLADSSRTSLLTDELTTYERLIIIDSALNDAPSAAKHYKQYFVLLDSNFRASSTRQAEELQVVYQTKEKTDEIALLNEQAKLEQANLKRATLTKNVTIGGIIAVLIITGLLYRQTRLRKKNNNVITHKNEQLQHLLTEKEWLLKEIHHRVKNNLQIVMSLLNSQSAYIDNEPALTAIHDSQHRVHAMSLIHQKLYNTENVSSIDISVYIRELASYLKDSFDKGQRIRFEFNIEPFEMDVSQAVPLGLILNESITNSIKYAFPGDRNGLITISLLQTRPGNYLLSISDNGVGMPPHTDTKKKGSLGMSLMKGLSEDIDGNFSIENNNGTTVKVSFKHDPDVKKPGTFASSFVTNN